MATEKVTPFAATVAKITPERVETGWEALRAAIAHVAALEREWQSDEDDHAALVIPTLIRRIKELHDVILDIMDANEIPLNELRAVVEGVPAEEVAHG